MFFYELSPLNYADHYGYDDHIVTTLVALVDQSLIKHQIFAHCILQKDFANNKLVWETNFFIAELLICGRRQVRQDRGTALGLWLVQWFTSFCFSASWQNAPKLTTVYSAPSTSIELQTVCFGLSLVSHSRGYVGTLWPPSISPCARVQPPQSTMVSSSSASPQLTVPVLLALDTPLSSPPRNQLPPVSNLVSPSPCLSNCQHCDRFSQTKHCNITDGSVSKAHHPVE